MILVDVDKEHIARISYGKDSLKMLEVIKSRGLPLDRITTTDVWATDTISARLPPMDSFVDRMDQWIWDHYRIEVEHLCAVNKDGTKKTYEQLFYHVPVRRSQIGNVEREREREPVPPRRYPWVARHRKAVVSERSQTICQNTAGRVRLPAFHRIPDTTGARSSNTHPAPSPAFQCWGDPGARGGLKSRVAHQWIPGTDLSLVQKAQDRQGQDTFSQERSTKRKDISVVEYLGIAVDEPKRHGQMNECKRAPLVEFDIDEDLCGLYCQYNGILAPTYETSCRDGCWFCHNQGVNQLRSLWRNYPDLWAILMKWDLDSPVSFKADGHTVHDFDRRFQMESEGLIPADRTFRWAMLYEPPKFIPMIGEQTKFF